MSFLGHCQGLWRHAEWADAEVLAAVRRAPRVPAEALREYAHVVGAEEVWLARLERRAPTSAVWPELTLDEAAALSRSNRDGYQRFLAGLGEEMLDERTHYTNSAGQSFATPVGEILLHVALHGQYHRGKINLLLRHESAEPAPVDYIAFVRGVEAARTAR